MICAIIPTYNNASTLGDIILRTAQYIRDIIVVVDGATDTTRDVLRAIEIPLTIIDLPQNGGKGHALKAGFRKAIEMGFTHALTIDSDGQHFPEDIPALLSVSQQQPNCFIVGSRDIQAANMPGTNTFANKFSNFWFTVQTGIRLPDTQTGMRIYPLQRLHGLSLLTSRYEAELELLVFAAWSNEKIIPVPVRVYYPSAEERISHFRPAYDFTRISILNTFLCFGALLYGLPRRYWRTLIYGPWFLLIWALTLLVIVVMMLFRAKEQTYRRFFSACSSLLMHTFPGSPFRIQGKEKALPPSTPAIYIANHTSLFDILSIVSGHPNLTIVTQNWVFSNPFFAAFAHKANFLPATAGFEQMAEQYRTEVEKGTSVLVFPEGSRSRNGALCRFHRGAFYLAQQLHVPLQPVLLEDTFRLMSKGEVRIGAAQPTLTFLDPIMPDDPLYQQTYQAMCSRVHQMYINQLTHYQA